MVSTHFREHVRDKLGADGKQHSVDYVELRGLSTDEKPVDYVSNGSIFYEIDTRKWLAFSEQTKEWM